MLIPWGGVFDLLSLQLLQLQLFQLALVRQLLAVADLELLTLCVALPLVPFRTCP